MSYTYTTRNGQRLESTVAADFDRMNADFKRDNGGVELVVTAGTRTRAEQESIFRARYVTAGGIRGRHVYDIRRWNGALWYRVSAAGTVATPGSSNHEEDGPNGPRSIDIRDTGSDAGVTRRGSARDKWMEAHAGNYGFENEGYNFNEPWHKTDRHALGSTTASSGTHAAVPEQVVKDRQNFLNAARGEKLVVDGLTGRNTVAAIKRYQTFLRGYGYSGAIDGDWGAGTQAAHQKYFDARSAPARSTTGRPILRKGSRGQMVASLQQRLNTNYPLYSKLRVDGEFGAATDKVVREFQRRSHLTVDGVVGAGTWGALGL